MKNLKLAFIAVLAVIFVFSSCKKKEKDPEPAPALASFSFPTTTDLEIEMTWTVNGIAAGDDYVDLDFEIYTGTTGATYNDIDGSYNSTGTEAITISKNITDFSGTLGINYYENEPAITGLTSPYTVVYTIKVYPTGNVAAAKTFSGTFVNPSTIPDQDLLYNQMSVVKTATSYTFNELSPKTTFDWSTIP
jgi:hypothetical protein